MIPTLRSKRNNYIRFICNPFLKDHRVCYRIIRILIVLVSLRFFGDDVLIAQKNALISHDDSLALENVIVEKYYVASREDYRDTTGGIVPGGSVTYRIFVQMKPGYTLQMVYGDKIHPLSLKTTTTFFNNNYCQAITGFNINPNDINKNSVALDSWITMGAATKIHTGVLRTMDHDGSILKRDALLKQDGLTNGIFPTFKAFNLDLNFFKDKKDASLFTTNDGGWAALGGGGARGPSPENMVLIAQLTTNGSLSFTLNLQLGTPSRNWVRFVADKPGISEIQFKGLSYK